jgi:hypothetical protein
MKGAQECRRSHGLLTPVIKGVLTDSGFANAVLAQQIFGGHGYIAEHGMEQFVRDARIAQIYEGANGIQALDLVDASSARMAAGRSWPSSTKCRPTEGACQQRFDERLSQAAGTVAGASAAGVDVVHAERDGEARQRRRRLIRLHAPLWPGRAGYMWCRIAEAVLAKLPKANGSAARLNAKLVTARFFMERMLPETATRLARIEAGAASTMELKDDAF